MCRKEGRIDCGPRCLPSALEVDRPDGVKPMTPMYGMLWTGYYYFFCVNIRLRLGTPFSYGSLCLVLLAEHTVTHWLTHTVADWFRPDTIVTRWICTKNSGIKVARKRRARAPRRDAIASCVTGQLVVRICNIRVTARMTYMCKERYVQMNATVILFCRHQNGVFKRTLNGARNGLFKKRQTPKSKSVDFF